MSKLKQISETPEHWVILRIPTEDNIDIPYYKVLGGWRGGYLDGDRWKFNSGITKVEEDYDSFYFYGYSGSCYNCRKKGYGLKDGVFGFSLYVQQVVENMIERGELEMGLKIEIMPEETDWKELIE